MAQADAGYQQKLQEGQATVDDALALGWAWLSLRQKDKAEGWALQAHNLALGSAELRQSASCQQISRVAQLSYALWMAHKPGAVVADKGYAGFASAVAGLARRGDLDAGMSWQECRNWAAMLGTAETRATVQAEVADASGRPRPAVSLIVAWAYARKGWLDVWRAYLDERVKATTGDTKARWLLARAQAEAVRTPNYLALHGRPWLQQALATAESEECRIEALARLVMANADAERFDLAQTLLESVRSQFSSQNQAAQLAALQSRIDEARFRSMEERLKAEQHLAARRELSSGN